MPISIGESRSDREKVGLLTRPGWSSGMIVASGGSPMNIFLACDRSPVRSRNRAFFFFFFSFSV